MKETISSVDRLKASFALAIKRTLNVSLRLMRLVLFQRTRPPADPKCVVVHLVGNVGDVVVAIPALIALRENYPASRLILLTSAAEPEKNFVGAGYLLEGASFLDGMEVYETEQLRNVHGALNLLKRVRKLKPELFVSLPPCNITITSVARNMMFARLTGARFAVGFEIVTLFLFAYEQARHTGIYPTEIQRNLGHLRDLGIHSPVVKFDIGSPDEKELHRVEEIAATNGHFVAICAGGKQAGHRWPLERFVEVARYLKSERGLNLIAVGNEKERDLGFELLKQAGGGVNLAGELSPRGTAELLSRSLFLLTNDTGPMHLAAARGKQVVAVYGSKDLPGRWHPAGEGHELFRAQTACRQCLFAAEEYDHCVRQIETKAVIAGCTRLLERLNYPETTYPGLPAEETSRPTVSRYANARR